MASSQQAPSAGKNERQRQRCARRTVQRLRCALQPAARRAIRRLLRLSRRSARGLIRLAAQIRRRCSGRRALGLPCKARGARFEQEAARWLRHRGYRILGRNLRAAGGEIDLLCRRGRILIVVEVRVRKAGLLAADLSVGAKKEARLAQTFRALKPRFGRRPDTPVRGDLLIGDGAGRWHLMEDALDLSRRG